MNILLLFEEYIKNENLFTKSDRLLLAVSGGMDSVVLSHLCKNAGYDFAIAHCNFQLRGEESIRDARFTEGLAGNLGVHFYLKTFDTGRIATTQKKSIEETARDLRYAWFEEVRSAEGFQYILTAHHADDNIETVVMNFFRGTGIQGLKGILPRQGRVVRPLLFAEQTDLEGYIKANGLDYVTDHTNLENNFTRNYFRNVVLPQVCTQYPEVRKNLLNNIRRFHDTFILYRQSIDRYRRQLVILKGNEVHIPVLKLLRSIPLATILFELVKDFSFTSHQLTDIIALLQSPTGKYVLSPTHRIFRNRKWLIVTPLAQSGVENILIEPGTDKVLFSEGLLRIHSLKNGPVSIPADRDTALLDASQIKYPLLLRKWKTGDYFYPLGMDKKKKLSRFFIDLKLSLSEKEKVWVIESGKKIIWIVGMRIDNRLRITSSTRKYIQFDFVRNAGA